MTMGDVELEERTRRKSQQELGMGFKQEKGLCILIYLLGFRDDPW